MFDTLEKLLIDYDWKPNHHTKTTNMRKHQMSLSVGLTNHWMKPGKPFLPTINMKNDPRIYNECKRLFPDFDFKMVIINKNFKSPPHKDKNNTQKSLIIGLGDYEGGDLIIENSKTGETERHCIWRSPLYFNGKDNVHYTGDWTGDRYSVILGNSKFSSYETADNKKDPYVIAIPSYQRPECLKNKTLKFLKECKIDKKKIDIFVANQEEKVLYEKILPKYYNKIIIAEKGLINARNFISNYYPENKKIVSIDDDVEQSLLKLKDGTYSQGEDSYEREPLTTKLDKFINLAFKECEKTGLNLWGIYPAYNAFFMKMKVSYELKYIVGCFWGCINKKVLLENDELAGLGDKEDFERTLKYYMRDGGVIRFNNVSVKTNYFTEEGGLQSDGRCLQRMKKNCERIKNKYPELVSIVEKKSVKFTNYFDIKLKDKDKKYYKKLSNRDFVEIL